jgi:hypothetical protein
VVVVEVVVLVVVEVVEVVVDVVVEVVEVVDEVTFKIALLLCSPGSLKFPFPFLSIHA